MLNVTPEVADALAEGRPVVALESTIVTHGMPYPDNLTTARGFQNAPPGISVDNILATAGLNDTSTAEQVVDYFIKLLVQAPIHSQLRQMLIDYLKKNDNGTIGTFTLDATTKDKKVRGLIHLLLSRPEAQNF